MRALVVAIVLAGCARAPVDSRVQPVVADSSNVHGPSALASGTSGSLRTPPDDTTAVMRAIGLQLRRDYRGGPLLFATRLTCDETEDSVPCGKRNAIEASRVVPRAIVVAVKAAEGHFAQDRQPGQPCSTPAAYCRLAKEAVALLALSAPMISGDSAFVRVVATFALEPGAETFAYERHIYRVTRMSQWHWRVTARYLDSEGHFEKRDSR